MRRGGWYRGKRVLVTGHTGFKGGWLVRMLALAGARVCGYALPAEPGSVFALCGGCRGEEGDIRDFARLRSLFAEFRPECVFHLAAQPIVLEGYRAPRETYEINGMGTVNLLECIRLSAACAAPCWSRRTRSMPSRRPRTRRRAAGRVRPVREQQELVRAGGGVLRALLSAGQDGAVRDARGQRAGGGDIAPGRILPDCIRAARKGEPIAVRSPDSVRPYQHVFDVLAAYLAVARAQRKIPLWRALQRGPGRSGCLTTGSSPTCSARRGRGRPGRRSRRRTPARTSRPPFAWTDGSCAARSASLPAARRRTPCGMPSHGRGRARRGRTWRALPMRSLRAIFRKGICFESRAARSGGPDPAAGRPARRPPCFSPFRRRFTVPRGPSACAAPFVPVARRPPSLSPFCRRFCRGIPYFSVIFRTAGAY